jgi:hypothetical protein
MYLLIKDSFQSIWLLQTENRKHNCRISRNEIANKFPALEDPYKQKKNNRKGRLGKEK